MSELSDEFAALAVEMLGEDGVPVSVVAQTRPGAMTSSGDRAGGSATPRNAMGIVLPDKGTTFVDGQERASERVIITPVDPWPTPGERVTINGRTLVVGDDGAKTYAPQGTPIIHDLAVAS